MGSRERILAKIRRARSSAHCYRFGGLTLGEPHATGDVFALGFDREGC